jgi:hypothetical protein
MANENFRGSRKHILDMLDSPNFEDRFNKLLKESGFAVSKTDPRAPMGHSNPREMQIRDFGPNHISELSIWKEIKRWWPTEGTSPMWDLLVTAKYDGHKGLVLVEAKAHENELDWNGKQLKDKPSKGSITNHKRIGECIGEACRSLNEVWGSLNDRYPGFNIHRKSRYQLANRIAFAWKLAQCGLPVVLLYMGFLGDEGISYVGTPLRDDDHWQRVIGAYMHDVVPQSFPGQRIPLSENGSMTMLVRSLRIIEPTKLPTTL